MTRMVRDVTEAELSVMEVLWEKGPCRRRRITDLLYPKGGPAQYATVQKLLERLESKGCVTKATDAGQLVFSAAVDRDGLLNRRLRDVAEKFCGGSVSPLVMNLVKSNTMSGAELRELQEYLASLLRDSRGKGERR